MSEVRSSPPALALAAVLGIAILAGGGYAYKVGSLKEEAELALTKSISKSANPIIMIPLSPGILRAIWFNLHSRIQCPPDVQKHVSTALNEVTLGREVALTMAHDLGHEQARSLADQLVLLPDLDDFASTPSDESLSREVVLRQVNDWNQELFRFSTAAIEVFRATLETQYKCTLDLTNLKIEQVTPHLALTREGVNQLSEDRFQKISKLSQARTKVYQQLPASDKRLLWLKAALQSALSR